MCCEIDAGLNARDKTHTTPSAFDVAQHDALYTTVLFRRWASVVNAGPTLKQQWVNISFPMGHVKTMQPLHSEH